MHSKTLLSCALVGLLTLTLLVTAASAHFVDPCYATRHNTFDLFAGRTIDAGWVDVQDNGYYLIVTFHAENGWYFTDANVAVADTVAGIPQTKNGGPIPGQFPYYQTNIMKDLVIFNIPLKDLPSHDSTLIMVTHATVTKDGVKNTAWGIDSCVDRALYSNFPGKTWATYFQYLLV